MGGNAIKIAERVPKDKFFEYAKKIIPMVEKAFDTKVSMVNSFKNKTDFGDLDLLVLENKNILNRRKVIEQTFDPQEIKVNSHIISFNHNELQVDLIFTSKEDWGTSKIFFEWGDLGNFMGKLINNYGDLADHGYLLKYGFDGLKCKILEQGKTKLVFISKDNKEVFKFLGLDFNKWEEGFNDKLDMFDYVITSPMFDYPAFQWENLNSINKDRNKRRPAYIEFLEYIKDHKKVIPWNNHPKEYLDIIKNFFSVDLLEERKNFTKDIAIKNIIKDKFNGTIIKELIPYLDGKELGKFIDSYKKSKENFDQYVYETDRVYVAQNILDFWHTIYTTK